MSLAHLFFILEGLFPLPHGDYGEQFGMGHAYVRLAGQLS